MNALTRSLTLSRFTRLTPKLATTPKVATFKPTLNSCKSSEIASRHFHTTPHAFQHSLPNTNPVPPPSAETLLQQDDPTDNTLEIKDAAIIFNNVWNKLEKKYGLENLRFPREVIWLMGAPGAGKSYNAAWILRARGITSRELVMSSLLTSPEAEKIKREAGLVGDSLVTELLLEKLLQPEYANGVLVDGFPRTKVQVECIKMFKDKMLALRAQFIDTKLGYHFRKPSFRVAVLFVDENESVERQLKRGREAREHNARVRETGTGSEVEERATDFSDDLAKRRYSIFKDHYSTLQELKKYFTFSVINTRASVNEVRERIYKEFMYQSSLELGEETLDAIQKIPVVSEITKHARQNLVRRLENYQTRHSESFHRVVEAIQREFVPLLEQHCVSGEALVRSKNPLFSESINRNIVIDILAERGYAVAHHALEERFPKSVNLTTGEIIADVTMTYLFKVKFQIPRIRNDLLDSFP